MTFMSMCFGNMSRFSNRFWRSKMGDHLLKDMIGMVVCMVESDLSAGVSAPEVAASHRHTGHFVGPHDAFHELAGTGT